MRTALAHQRAALSASGIVGAGGGAASTPASAPTAPTAATRPGGTVLDPGLERVGNRAVGSVLEDILLGAAVLAGGIWLVRQS
jgi:hypothetical protein